MTEYSTARSRGTGRTQRMLEDAAAHHGLVVVIAANAEHAVSLRERAKAMGATNITVKTSAEYLARGQAYPRVMWDHYAVESEKPKRAKGAAQ